MIALTLLDPAGGRRRLGRVLIGFGAASPTRVARVAAARRRADQGGDGRYRLLVVANETVGGEALLEEIRDRCRDRSCEILVVTPALAASRAAHWASDIDEAIELARQRMELSLIGSSSSWA